MSARGSAIAPRTRSHQVIVRHLGDETLVYDRTAHRAHCLNSSASLVFARCDGATTPEELDRALAHELGIPEAKARQVVEVALGALAEARLLEDGSPGAEAPTPARPSRRKALRTIAAASVWPVVLSIIAPTPAEAQTCIERFAPCNSSQECCSPFNCCRTGPFHPGQRRCHRAPLPAHPCAP